MKSRLIASICLAAALSASATAGFVVPTSYTATPGEGQAQGGSFNYFDDTGSQLTDGVFGVDNWMADLGNGYAYEWVGWGLAEPTMTFSFASSVTLQKVSIGLNRAQAALIHLPSTVTIGGSAFALSGSELADGTRGDLEFAGSWTGTSLQISLTDGNPGVWIFVDEIRFEVIPEPNTIALAVGLGLADFAFHRRVRRA